MLLSLFSHRYKTGLGGVKGERREEGRGYIISGMKGRHLSWVGTVTNTMGKLTSGVSREKKSGDNVTEQQKSVVESKLFFI